MEGAEVLAKNKNFDKICRVCLKCDEAQEVQEFKPLLYQLFKKLIELPDKENFNLPNGICKECKLRLQDISTFIETCKTNQMILEKEYSNGESKENNENFMNIESDKNPAKILDKEVAKKPSNVLINTNAIEDCFETTQECLDIHKKCLEVTENFKPMEEDVSLNNKKNKSNLIEQNEKFKSNSKDLNEMCRVCLIEPKPPDLQKFQPHLYNLFKKLIEIPEKENDACLSRKICKECKSRLEDISMFIDKCKTNEMNLEKLCSNKNIELISENDRNIEIEIWPNEETEENELNMMVNAAKEELDLGPEDIKLEYEDVQTDDLDDAECTLLSDEEDDSLDHERKDGNSVPSLPDKSRPRYEKCYKLFMNWLKTKKGNDSSISEHVLMEYMQDISKKFQPNSLWTHYSMLRSTLKIYNNLDITNYLRLKALLKRKSTGYIPKKPKTLTSEQIQQFIAEAPDEIHLFTKVALIIGIHGGCKRRELCQMTIDDVEDLGSAAIFKIHDAKSAHPRVFTITGQFYELFKKYYNLRPPRISERRLFINYQNEKCTSQVVGINKLGTVPKIVAKYLHLKDPELYNTQSLIKTSGTVSLYRRQHSRAKD